MSESQRSELLGRLSRKHSVSKLSSSIVLVYLMEALEAEDIQGVINRIHQMSLDLDELKAIPEHLEQIQFHVSKIRRLMPEEVL